MSNSLNGNQPPLVADYANAVKLPAYYDTDLENYDTNPSRYLNLNSLTRKKNN